MRRLLFAAVVAASTLTAGAASARADHRDVVVGWYGRYLGRPAEHHGLHAHVHALRAGTPALQVEAAILGSSEYYVRHGGCIDGYITGLYVDVLGHRPTPREVRYWTARLDHCGNREVLAVEFLREHRPVVVAPAPVPVYRPAIVDPVVVVRPAPVVVPPVRVAPSFGLSIRIGR
jgi:hypothetical protein